LTYLKDYRYYSKEFLDQHAQSKHLGMFERLYKDFKENQIIKIKKEDKKVLMINESRTDTHRVTFVLNVDENDSDKINGISVEMGNFN
jgi:hypothetical protein